MLSVQPNGLLPPSMENGVPTQHSGTPFALRHTRSAGGKEGRDEKAQAQPEQKQVSIETGARCT